MPDMKYQVIATMKNGKVYITQEITCQVPFDKPRQEIAEALATMVNGEFGQAARGGALFDLGSNVTEAGTDYTYAGRTAINPNELVTLMVEVTDWCGYPEDTVTPPAS